VGGLPLPQPVREVARCEEVVEDEVLWRQHGIDMGTFAAEEGMDHRSSAAVGEPCGEFCHLVTRVRVGGPRGDEHDSAGLTPTKPIKVHLLDLAPPSEVEQDRGPRAPRCSGRDVVAHVHPSGKEQRHDHRRGGCGIDHLSQRRLLHVDEAQVDRQVRQASPDGGEQRGIRGLSGR